MDQVENYNSDIKYINDFTEKIKEELKQYKERAESKIKSLKDDYKIKKRELKNIIFSFRSEFIKHIKNLIEENDDGNLKETINDKINEMFNDEQNKSYIERLNSDINEYEFFDVYTAIVHAFNEYFNKNIAILDDKFKCYNKKYVQSTGLSGYEIGGRKALVPYDNSINDDHLVNFETGFAVNIRHRLQNLNTQNEYLKLIEDNFEKTEEEQKKVNEFIKHTLSLEKMKEFQIKDEDSCFGIFLDLNKKENDESKKNKTKDLIKKFISSNKSFQSFIDEEVDEIAISKRFF